MKICAKLGMKTRPGDDSPAGEIPKNQSPGDGGEKREQKEARAIDAGAKKGAKKPEAAAGELSKNQLPGDVSEHTGNPEEYKGVTFKDNPAAELAKKGHAGDLSPPRTPATPPCPATVEHSGELPAPDDCSNLPALDSGELPPGHVSGDPNPKSGEHPVNPTAAETIVKLIRAQRKENEENVLKGMERLLELHSDMEKERSRISLNNQTTWILLGVLVEISVVRAACFIFLV